MPRTHAKLKSSKPIVLLTGFGPFPGVAENISGALVEALAARAQKKFRGHIFKSEILATEWRRAPLRVSALLDDLQPALALHFGVASGSSTLRLETQGANACRIADDASGLPPLASVLSASGDAHHAVSIPVDAIYQRLKTNGYPVSISSDAGGYLCNAVLYQSLSHSRAQERPARAGFIHLPDDLSRPPLTFSVALNACLIVIETCLADG